MTKKLDHKKFKQRHDLEAEKVTVYMNLGHKWMIEELAYLDRKTQKAIIYDILQNYWDNKASKME